MYLPIWFKTEQFNCLLIGGGHVALAKAKRLLNLGCRITLIAPEIASEFYNIEPDKLQFHNREFKSGDCKGYGLVIAATPNREVNKAVVKEASTLNVPVNVVDDPELCTVIFSANMKDDNLNIAVSTEGTAPFLAAAIRNKLLAATDGWGEWVNAGGRLRDLLLDKGIEKSEMYRLLEIFAATDLDNVDNFPEKDASYDDWLKWLKHKGK